MSPSTKKILIIEDEKAFVDNLSLALDKKSFKLIIALDGPEALKKVKKEKPALILLDLLLPGMSGLEVLRKLKAEKETQDIPVIVLTNLTDSKTISDIVKAGGKEYLVKSDYTLSEVVDKIKRVLAKEPI